MSYVYDQRKRPQGLQNTEPERTAAPGPGMDALMTGTARPAAARKGRSFDLDAAMKAKMEHAFGDLSVVKDYPPPAQTQAPAPAVPYTGPVTHALSNASPSPAAAGPMQAKRDNRSYEQRWKDSGGDEKMMAFGNAQDLPADDPDVAARRPYDLTEQELQANPFNPTNSNDLTKTQLAIEAMDSPYQAYTAFTGYGAGNLNGSLLKADGSNWDPYEVDPKHFKNKLKHMARVVHDYPELKGKLGNMVSATDSVMAVSPATGKHKAEFDYNQTIDSMSLWGRLKHSLINWGNKKFGVTTQKSLDYTGTHELGHVLNSLLLNPKNEKDADNDWHYNITADSIVDSALKKTMPKEEYNKLKRYKKTSYKNRYKRGQIDLRGSSLFMKGYTSWYGGSNAAEFFAEAFADVYSHGENAKPVSIEVVKEYERRREKMKNRPEIEGLDEIPDDLPGDELNDSMIVHTGRPRKKKKKKN